MHYSDHLFYRTKGVATVLYDGSSILVEKHDWPETALDSHMQRICGDIMDGEEFYDCVDSGSIIDYDGLLGEVYINGYKSNLGLAHRGLRQGGFLVDGETWLKLCRDYDIEVEWCNK